MSRNEVAELIDDPETEEDVEADRARKAAQLRIDILDALGMRLAKTRSEAIDWRARCGIEDEWREDEEHYEGVDDANRAEHGNRITTWRSKPAGQVEPRQLNASAGSTVFPNITRPYCDAAAARVGDMLLPTADPSWSIKPTPFPELMEIAEGEFPEHIEAQIEQGAPEGLQGEERAAWVAKTKADAQEGEAKLLKAATKAAEKAQKRIQDWLVECSWNAEFRRVLEDATRSGTGVIKGPVPVQRRVVAFKGGKIQIVQEMKPASSRIDKWNLYPDPACGDNIHRGGFIWERDELTRKKLQDLKRDDTYISDQIEAALKEGPHRASAAWDTEKRAHLAGLDRESTDNVFEVWYCYCRVQRLDLEQAGVEFDEGDPQDADEWFDVALTMVNNRVIRATRNALDTGEFPYDIFVWQRRDGIPWGIGVARQIRTPQKIVVGATRAMMDNAGISGFPMMIYKDGIVEPARGAPEIRAGKIWIAKEDAVMDDVRKALSFILVPSNQAQMEAIILLGLKLAEDVTGMPMIMQGSQGTAPDTVGGMQILNNNSGTVMRRVAKLVDDLVTEPHIRRYYAYLLQWGPDDSEKGDFLIDARGSSALVERDLQNQQIGQMASMVVNPIFKKDPAKWVDEWLRSNKLDPEKFNYDDEEWQQLVQKLAQGPGNPAAEVAQIRAQNALEIQAMKDVQSDKDRDMQASLAEMESELEGVAQQIGRADVLDKLKGDLAKVVLQLKTQKELSAQREVAKQVAKPPSEPAGRAKPGEAYAA